MASAPSEADAWYSRLMIELKWVEVISLDTFDENEMRITAEKCGLGSDWDVKNSFTLLCLREPAPQQPTESVRITYLTLGVPPKGFVEALESGVQMRGAMSRDPVAEAIFRVGAIEWELMIHLARDGWPADWIFGAHAELGPES